MTNFPDNILSTYSIVITSNAVIISVPAIVEICKANIEKLRHTNETVDILIKKGGYISLYKNYKRLEIILL